MALATEGVALLAVATALPQLVPLSWAVAVSVATDLLAYLPTFRHAWLRPQEEPWLPYALFGAAAALVLWVADHRILVGGIYPMYLFAADATMVIMILVSPHGRDIVPAATPPARVPARTHDAAVPRVGAVAAGNRAGLASESRRTTEGYSLVTSLAWNVYLAMAARTRWRRPGGMACRSCSRCPAGTSPLSMTRRSRVRGPIPPLRLLDVRHEQTAVFAAEATARLTRTPGLAAVTAGPGVTNSVSAVTTAWFNGAPVVVLAGRAPDSRWGAGSLQEMDHPPLLAASPSAPGPSTTQRRWGPRWTRPSGWP